MKINFLLPQIGVTGGIRVVFEYANRLDSRGHDVTILYPTIPLRMTNDLLAPKARAGQLFRGVQRIINGENVEWFDLEVPIRRVPTFSPALIGYLDGFIPDADITIATAWDTAYTAAALGPGKGEKAYFVQHYEIWPLWNDMTCWEMATENHSDPSLGMVDVSPADSELANYKRLVDKSYELPLHLIVTSDWEKKVMNRMGNTIAGSTSYGVNFDQFYPVDSTKSAEFSLIALYRNKSHKGDKEAIEAFQRLHERHDNIEFIMFGTEWSNDVPDFVDFYEDPAQDKLRALYSRADLLVYPSWVEGYGMPPMEAMACRTALVSTDVGAVRQYTPSDGVRFVPVHDSAAIVAEVESLLDTPQEIETMKERCHEYIQQYTWERATTEFEDVVTTIV